MKAKTGGVKKIGKTVRMVYFSFVPKKPKVSFVGDKRIEISTINSAKHLI